jgi:hypothetical protein
MLLQALLCWAIFCLTHGAKNYNLKENMRQQTGVCPSVNEFTDFFIQNLHKQVSFHF